MSLPTTITPLTNTIIFGFDSAWTDKNPGAMCVLSFDDCGQVTYNPPRLAKFRDALSHIELLRMPAGRTVVAIDQPTIVPNASGIRPAERIAASVLSYTGGGVQPANKGKAAMFGDKAPIWQFKKELGAEDDPELARSSDSGLFLVEVFPALALPGLHIEFAGRYCAPKYNPENRTKFRAFDWEAVVKAMAAIAQNLELEECAEWCRTLCTIFKPTKGDQDQLDSVICAIIGYIWLACKRSNTMILGDLETGYIVTPVSRETSVRLKTAANDKGVECN